MDTLRFENERLNLGLCVGLGIFATTGHQVDVFTRPSTSSSAWTLAVSLSRALVSGTNLYFGVSVHFGGNKLVICENQRFPAIHEELSKLLTDDDGCQSRI